METIKILICDDHPLINEGLQKMINNIDNMQIMDSATTVLYLMQVLQQKLPDIILLDINLPDGNGIDVCLTIKKQFPQVKILVISSNGDRSSLIKMIRNGASGYLLKSAPASEIENAINLVYQGGTYYSDEMQKLVTTVLSDILQNEQPPVTRREKEILTCLKQGLNSQQIAEKLFISPLTVETHRKNLLSKFNVGKTINMLEKATAMGLIS
jgi:DNA-binding NarL/FixJ family response regulator